MIGADNNELEQLIQNDKFIRWVIAPDASSDQYWQSWQNEYYSRKELVEEAKQIVLSIYRSEAANTVNPTDDIIRQSWQKINNQTQNPEVSKPVRTFRWYKYAAAAAVIIAVAITWVKLGSAIAPENQTVPEPQTVQTKSEIVISNNESRDKIINLPDGSRIILAKSSAITYNRLFNNDIREIFLSGEAFFEVAKDATRPFYVYSGNVVTKVLGTSFRIVSDSKTDKVTVAVKTGKVTVFRKNKEQEDKDKYILKPSEQLVFENVKTNPLKQIVANKALIENNLPAVTQFDFESASLPSILEALSKHYSVEIVNSNSRPEPCLVTASLSEGSLYDKLNFLHKVTGIEYYIKNQVIYVDSKECK